jgi:phenylpropionate dioxygenase-like ring-hydroxylating dioxygenase large terminal subunit
MALTREQNELLTRVGPGTAMGEMLREYWMPAVHSAALERDGAPKRVRLMGENFVAFRASDGSVGLVDEACPHRGASLALGRNEQGGLRCIFHGWKIDPSGQVVETPCEPADRRAAFAAAQQVRAFPTHEVGGVVWVYLGKEATPPRFPEFEFTKLPASHVDIRRGLVHYNWLQGLEAHIDSSHVGVLHSGFIGRGVGDAQLRDLNLTMVDTAPEFEMDVTSYGLREGALRSVGEGRTYARIRQIVLPFFTFIPGAKGDPCSGRATVPVDDEWDAEWYIVYDPDQPVTPERLANLYRGASQDPEDFAANLGTADNFWHQDRDAMKAGHWSGLTRNIPFEDFIIQSSMGPLVDRSKEQLGAADAIIVRTRRLLLDAVEEYRLSGTIPWRSDEIDFAAIRALAVTFPKEQDWRQFAPDYLAHKAAAE